MKNKYKNRFLKDLRSGKYEQGRGALEHVSEEGKSTFCCLGVLCKTNPSVAKRVKQRSSRPMNVNYVGTDGREKMELTESMRQAFGITRDEMSILIGMNDKTAYRSIEDFSVRIDPDHYHTFNEIADWVEENL